MAPCLSTLLLLVAVAFFTLIERKVLSYIMIRKGPNKPSFIGIITPFADALNLLSNPFIFPTTGSPHLIVFSCLLSFLIPCQLFSFIYSPSLVWCFEFTVLGILIWLSLSVYSLLSAGYGSNSKYSILGGLRSLAQCISYEVSLTTLLLCYCLFASFRITNPQPWCYCVFLPHLCLLLIVVGLAETNRSPFDFAEGESELVSGYNVEYSGPGFVILFLSEYLSILWMSTFISNLCIFISFNFMLMGSIILAFGFIWARGSLPRLRYDQLMSISWKSLLPVSLFTFILLILCYCLLIALNAFFISSQWVVLQFTFFLVLVFFSFFLIYLEYLFVLTPLSVEVLSSYECGFEPCGSSRLPFCMNFFLLAIIFLVFDVEISLLIPCLYSSLFALTFLFLLLLGLLHEYCYGGLDWIL